MVEFSTPANWPKAVIMDLDGTLIDSAPDIASALNKALANEGIETFLLKDVRFMIGGGVPKLVERAFDAHGMPHDDRMLKVIDDVMGFYTAQPAMHTMIYDGVELTLKTLKNKGVKVGLCTNKPQTITELALNRLKLDHYFDAIVGGTAETPRKPDPMTLKMCVDQLGLAVDDCLLVGDSGADKGAAEALDMSVFLVNYGYSKTPVAEFQPDAVLAKMPDLLKLLFPSEQFS